jgi:hypothetical protein
MKFRHASLFIHHPDTRRWLSDLVDYITASYTNPELWQLIQELAAEETADWSASIDQQAAQQGRTRQAVMNAQGGGMPYEYASPEKFVSIAFFLSLSEKLYKLGKNDDYAGGSLDSVGEAFELLLESGLFEIRYNIYERDVYRGSRSKSRNQHYTVNENGIKYLVENNLLYNYLFGVGYIIDRYSNSVVKIEVEQKGDIALGTGWLYDIKTNDPTNPIIRLVVTNKHVLADTRYIKVFGRDNSVIMRHEVALLEESPELDIAYIRIDYDSEIPAFITESGVDLLEEIITIGYPSVPLAKEAYQLVHRGDVNALVQDVWGNDLLIISARTAPGSSGSPVIDETGRVVGMAAQQLFEKQVFEEKGITPYSACIPAGIIAQVILESAFVSSFMKQAPKPATPSPHH